MPLRPLPGKEAKPPPSPRTSLREDEEQPRVASNEGAEGMDFETAAIFAVSPTGQADVAPRGAEETDRNAAQQAEGEALRGANELEPQGKANARQNLMEATAT